MAEKAAWVVLAVLYLWFCWNVFRTPADWR